MPMQRLALLLGLICLACAQTPVVSNSVREDACSDGRMLRDRYFGGWPPTVFDTQVLAGYLEDYAFDLCLAGESRSRPKEGALALRCTFGSARRPTVVVRFDDNVCVVRHRKLVTDEHDRWMTLATERKVEREECGELATLVSKAMATVERADEYAFLIDGEHLLYEFSEGTRLRLGQLVMPEPTQYAVRACRALIDAARADR